MPAHLLEALLAHELAHVRRHDYLVNLLQNAIEALLFYHPAVWWLSRRIRAERELIADELAAGQLGEPRRLALALSELEQLQFSTTRLAQAANGGDLMSRIKHLLRPESQSLNWKAAVPVIGFALAALAGCAQQPPSKLAAAPGDTQPHTVRAEPAVAIGAPGIYATGPVTIQAKSSENGPVTVTAEAFEKIDADAADTIAVADMGSCNRPVYPAQALQRKAHGTVTLGFLVGADGSVRDTAVRRSSGDSSLDEAARAALAKCSFRPAMVNGAPVEKWTQVQYVWMPD
jgi:D-alanyl-D-alanine endopeptidase (penicillin-binding protein 7)